MIAGVGGWIALVVRLVVPLLILRRPLAGGIAAIVADTSDIVLMNLFGFPPWDYHHFDKLLDLYYLGLEAAVALRWKPFPRAVALTLFGWRLVGVAVFEATDARWLLLAAPNLFEWYWLFVLAVARFRPGYALTPRRTATWLVVLLVPKLAQEYLFHVRQVLDGIVLSDLVRRLLGAE